MLDKFIHFFGIVLFPKKRTTQIGAYLTSTIDFSDVFNQSNVNILPTHATSVLNADDVFLNSGVSQ